MPNHSNADFFLQAASESLRFDYYGGGVTEMHYPHSTGWRNLPFITMSQIVGGRHSLRLADGREWHIEAGDAICTTPGVPHLADKVSPPPSVSRWSHVNFLVFGSLNLATLLDFPHVLSGQAAQRVGDINAELAALAEQTAPQTHHQLRVRALGLLLASILIEYARPAPQPSAFRRHAERLAPALAHIEAHLDAPLPRDALASLVCLSPSRFYTVFQEALGLSPSAYIQNLRMQRAQQLLLQTGLSIEEVAAQAGYPDSFHFSRLFKKRLGLSPAAYRSRLQAGLRAG